MDPTTQRLDAATPLPDRATSKLPANESPDEPACLRCHTPLVWARVINSPDGIRKEAPSIYLEQTEGFLIGWGPARTLLSGALVCPECGYTEFYIAEPQKMRDQKRELAP